MICSRWSLCVVLALLLGLGGLLSPLPQAWSQGEMDSDMDGVPDGADYCPFDPCDQCRSDTDVDGIFDDVDDDIDGDGFPNALDPDKDGDGVPNEYDPCPGGMYFATCNGCTADSNHNNWLDADECTSGPLEPRPKVCFWWQPDPLMSGPGTGVMGFDMRCEGSADPQLPCECLTWNETSQAWEYLNDHNTKFDAATIALDGFHPENCLGDPGGGGGGSGGQTCDLPGDCCWQIGDDPDGDGPMPAWVDDDDDDNDGIPDTYDECPLCPYQCLQSETLNIATGQQEVVYTHCWITPAQTWSSAGSEGACECWGCPASRAQVPVGLWSTWDFVGLHQDTNIFPGCSGDLDWDDDGTANEDDTDCPAACKTCGWCDRVSQQAATVYGEIDQEFAISELHGLFSDALGFTTSESEREIPVISLPLPATVFGFTLPQSEITIDLNPYVGYHDVEAYTPYLTNGLWLLKKALLAMWVLALMPLFIKAVQA